MRTFLIGENEQRIPMMKATEAQIKQYPREVVNKNGTAVRVFQPEEVEKTYEQLEAVRQSNAGPTKNRGV